MTGQLASPATWPPQPERRPPRHGAGGAAWRTAARTGTRLAACAVAGIMLCRCYIRMPGTQLVTPDAASKACGRGTCRAAPFCCAAGPCPACPPARRAPGVRRRGNGPRLRPDVVHVAPAFTCTLLVLLLNYAALLASRDTPPSSVVTAPAQAGARNPAARRHNVPSGHAVTTARTGRRSAKTPGIPFRQPWAAAAAA